MSHDYRIAPDTPDSAEIAALLQMHLDQMHQWSPPESVHAMAADRLRQSDMTFYAAWNGDELAACGALKELDTEHGELKSMRAAPAWRGKGAGKAMLLHLLSEAKTRGYSRVSLETGRPEAFLPARRLYETHGFTECPPFANYVLDDFSICMSRNL